MKLHLIALGALFVLGGNPIQAEEREIEVRSSADTETGEHEAHGERGGRDGMMGGHGERGDMKPHMEKMETHMEEMHQRLEKIEQRLHSIEGMLEQLLQ